MLVETYQDFEDKGVARSAHRVRIKTACGAVFELLDSPGGGLRVAAGLLKIAVHPEAANAVRLNEVVQ